jgi:predicted RNA binding protein YcfA (HicA-like mRNA interferase family)
MATKVADALKRLHADGWRITSQTGSHRQLEHPTKPGKVTVAGKPSDTIPPGTWNNIQRQAGWRP